MHRKRTTTRITILAGLLLALTTIALPAHAATRTTDLTRPVIGGVT